MYCGLKSLSLHEIDGLRNGKVHFLQVLYAPSARPRSHAKQRVWAYPSPNNDMNQNPTITHISETAASPLAAFGHEPLVTVGIVSGKRITFSLNEPYGTDSTHVKGDQTAEFDNGSILWNG